MNIVLTHPGTQHSFRLARELNRLNRLSKFVTSLAISENLAWIGSMVPKLERRMMQKVESSKFKSYPSLAVLEAALKIFKYSDEDIYYLRNLKFQERVIANDLRDADVVIGFDTSSWKLARYCADNNKKFVLDVSIGSANSKEKIFSELRMVYPEWADISTTKDDRLIKLELEELELATSVVVPSAFVKKTLVENGISDEKIYINPFGTDMACDIKRLPKKRGDKIRFLFFGALTARKGLPFLLDAWRKLETTNAELIVAGYGNTPESVSIPDGVHLMGAIPMLKRKTLFAEADIFVFPSYFEGLAQVQIEAAASGLPIIGTTNSGASEIVKHQISGFIIEPGNVEQLMNSMNHFIHNPGEISTMSDQILKEIDFFSWNSYGDRWANILRSI